jgi:hypothetical protein
MNLHRYLAIAITSVLALVVPFAQAPDDALATVRRLYESASYQEPLAALGTLSPEAHADQIDDYSALCLLGPNRARDAEQALERLVIRHPTATFDPAGHSPKFISLHRSVKERTLPIVVAALYRLAKANLEGGLYGVLGTVQAVLTRLSDPQAATLSDLKLVAEGFSKLAEERLLPISPADRTAEPAAKGGRPGAVH